MTVKRNRADAVRRPVHPKASVWLAVFALFLQLLVPSLHGRLLAATASAGEIVICTPQGIQHLVIDEDGSARLDMSKAPSNKADISKQCPVCQTVHAGLGLPAGLSAGVLAPEVRPASQPIVRDQIVLAAELWQRPATRAPPVSI